nr:hypothetical protein VW1_00084 [Enterobacter sp.]
MNARVNTGSVMSVMPRKSSVNGVGIIMSVARTPRWIISRLLNFRQGGQRVV